MKKFFALVLMTYSLSAIAGQNEYDECILKHLKGAKIDVVSHLVMQACRDNYKSPSFTNEKKKAFNECLLEHLPGVESVPAAMEIKDVCNRKSKEKSR